MSKTHRLLVRHARQLVQVCAQGERFKTREAMSDVAVITDAALVVGQDGRILAVGPDADVAAAYADAAFDETIDASGMCVLPGFADGHTHPVWSGDRVHEFALKLAGASYMDVHKAGGGIGFTVKHTRSSSEDELLDLLKARLQRMLATGTTLAEGKSGYGLDSETELKMLRVLHRANQLHPIEIVSTFCGAHSVPAGSTAAAATEDVVTKQIPAVAAARAAGESNATLIDVFLEKGVFERDDTRRILQAGAAAGMRANFHGDEIHPMQAGELAGELGALAVSHLEHVTDQGIAAMAKVPTFAVLLPTTAYILRLEPPPARKMIDAGVPVALGSDFNPNAHCTSMPMTMHLACILMRMNMNEALVAATINAAASMGMAESHGSLEVGKHGNFVLLDAPMWEHVIYRLGDPPIHRVVVDGRTVFAASQ